MRPTSSSSTARDGCWCSAAPRSRTCTPATTTSAAGGVVAAGESYEENAEREAAEELGIRDTALEPKLDFYHEDERNRCFGRVFTCVHEGPFTLQAEEVESVAFHTVEEIAAGDVAPVTPDSRLAFDRLLALGEAAGARNEGPVRRRVSRTN